MRRCNHSISRTRSVGDPGQTNPFGTQGDSVEFIESAVDARNFIILRQSVSDFIAGLAATYDGAGVRVLDIAPESHAGAVASFVAANVETMDIDPTSGATYIADLCVDNQAVVPDDAFDVIICTEVLEHTLRPWDAVVELRRMLRPGGVLGITTPFNFRIHGPAPDCWRFTADGLASLLSDFAEVSVVEIPDPDRPRMPVHYQTVARKA